MQCFQRPRVRSCTRTGWKFDTPIFCSTELLPSDLILKVAEKLSQTLWDKAIRTAVSLERMAPCKATLQQLEEFFLHLQKELKLSVVAINPYTAGGTPMYQ